MRCASSFSLMWRCALVMAVCVAVVSASAMTLSDCQAQYHCSRYTSTKTLAAVGDTCWCCATDASGAVTTSCVAPIPYTTSGSHTSSTAACNVVNCAACASGSSGTCQRCEEGYVLSSDSLSCTAAATTTPTTTTPTSAAPTPTSTTTTTTTPATAVPQCTVPHCSACASDNSSACVACEAGYMLSEGRCVLNGVCLVPHCAQCMLQDQTKCSVCENGYVRNSALGCVLNEGNGALVGHSQWVAAVVAAVATVVAAHLV